MPADRLLGTLLRSLQTLDSPEDTPKIFGSASSILTTLNNPLNITLLTSQLVSARAIWGRPQDLRTCSQCLSVFHSAARAIVRHEAALSERKADREFEQLQLERTLPKNDWIRAVINGADDHSPRWRHLLILGGLLLGFGHPDLENLSTSMRGTIEQALVTATNLALEQDPHDAHLGPQTLTMVLNHCFPMIANHERSRLNFDALLPVLTQVALRSSEGLRSGYFLGAVDADVQAGHDSRLRWSAHSRTFQDIEQMLKSPILSSLGPLARLIGHAVDQVQQPRQVLAIFDQVQSFAETLHLQWRQNKLSAVDVSEENASLDAATHNETMPQLWKLLRSALFAVVIILRSSLGRVLGDAVLARNEAAPIVAAQALRTLRSLYFVSTRMNLASFTQHTFVYLAAADILAAYPSHAEAFVHSIRPAELASVPKHPMDRCLDLFFLNTAEHFTLVLPVTSNEELLIGAATPYLVAGGDNHLLNIFEAAHSVMLAVFSAPQNVEITARHLPFYVEALFRVFPHNLSARQFRMAFKTLLRLTSPPSIISTSQPMMSAVLLELLHERALSASTIAIPPRNPESASPEDPDAPALSEQAVLTLTIIDTLPEISLELLEEWLPLSTALANSILHDEMRSYALQHFWRILVGGEMDPDRSQICHSWWSTAGGREAVLFGRADTAYEAATMSGALPSEGFGSKL